MLRNTALRFPPKGPNSFWQTIQTKGLKEASKYAQSYAKNFSKSQQGQDICKTFAKTTAAVELKARNTFNHYWNAFHEVKGNIKTGSSSSSSSSSDNQQQNTNNNNAGSSSSSSSGESSSTTGGGNNKRTFYQRAEDFWNNNKDYIMGFIAANFMGVIFAIQFGGQIWSLVTGLWGVYWANRQAKLKKLEEEARRERVKRLAAEEKEDGLDDVYGGRGDGVVNEHAFVAPSGSSDESKSIGLKNPNARASSATVAAEDEESLQKRLARREERRRRKEMEDSGLVLHDDAYAKREEQRQSSAFAGAASARKLEKEEVRQVSAMEMLATQLITQEEDESIGGALSATTDASDAENARRQQQLYLKRQADARMARKQLTRKMKRKLRKAERQKELQAFFAQREAAQLAAGNSAGMGTTSASSASTSSASSSTPAQDAAAAVRHQQDLVHNALAFSDSFSYKVGGGENTTYQSFAAAHDTTHAQYREDSLSGDGGVTGTLKTAFRQAFGLGGGEGNGKDRHIFDFTSPSSYSSNSTADTKPKNRTNRNGGVHDFTS